MLNSTILDVAIGMVFCFASVALFVSAVNEGIASLLKLRHTTLLGGVKQLLNDPAGIGLALQLYNHALVNPLVTPTYRNVTVDIVENGTKESGKVLRMPGRSSLPAYIPSSAFASALIEVLAEAPNDAAAMKKAVDAVADPQLKQLLQGFMARAGTDIEAFRQHLADWFDNAMNRLSGGYKRQAQLMTFLLGLLAAVALNINAFYVLDQLWQKPSLAAVLSSPASAEMIKSMAAYADRAAAAASSPARAASAALPVEQWSSALGALPVGWDKGLKPPKSEDEQFLWIWFVLITGWLVTATASVFGAPFWFDLLQSLVQVRGTGSKPPADRDKNKAVVTSAPFR